MNHSNSCFENRLEAKKWNWAEQLGSYFNSLGGGYWW